MPFRRRNIDDEVMQYISEHIDRDIDSIINDEAVNTGNLDVSDFDKFEMFQNISEKIEKRERRHSIMRLGWACSFLLILFNLAYFTYDKFQGNKFAYQEIVSGKGEHLVVVLADGSKVWLNSDSRLVYPDKFTSDERKVTLEGEAYFEVAKDEDAPFKVQAEQMIIKVLGTSFNVMAYPDEKIIRTTLLKGKIKIGKDDDESKLVEMKPGQTAVFDKSNLTCVVSDNDFYKEDFYWRDNKMSFRNTPLKEVLNSLSKQFNVTFDIRGAGISAFTYDFVCKTNDLRDILDIMAVITPIKFKKISEDAYEVR